MKRALSYEEHINRLDLAIHLEDVTVAYNNQPVLWDIDLEVVAGTLMGILGPNKSGKTTLIKTILGLIKPESGKVYIFARPTATLKNDIAYVPELSSINWSFPTTLKDLVTMGAYNRIKLFKTIPLKDKDIVEEALKQTSLYNIKHKSIYDLSHGEMQRALLARALVQDSRIYLMDEPCLLSDTKSTEIIIEVIKDLKNKGKTLVVAYHDMMSIPKYFDSAVLLSEKKAIPKLLQSKDEVITITNIKKVKTKKSSNTNDGEY